MNAAKTSLTAARVPDGDGKKAAMATIQSADFPRDLAAIYKLYMLRLAQCEYLT